MNKAHAANLDRKINKEIFSVSCAAFSLADHAMRLQKVVKLSDYENHLNQLKQPDQAFIFKLRNNLNHIDWFEADWLIHRDRNNRTTHYTFKKSDLLLAEGWGADANAYLTSAPKTRGWPR